MNKTINILELASELADARLREEAGCMSRQNYISIFPDGIDIEEGDTYTEEAQDVFNDYYDYYYTIIEKVGGWGKVFSINGYWKEDKAEFEGYLVYEYDDMHPTINDDDILHYGLGEEEIKAAIQDGENTIHDFVITSYEKTEF
jgi:hypothetical protein